MNALPTRFCQHGCVSAAFLTVLPYALGAMVSPVLLTVEVLILASGTKPKLRAWVYAAGVAIIALVLLVLFATLLRTLSTGSGGPSGMERGIEITGAIVLALLAVRSFLPKQAAEHQHPSKIQDWTSSEHLRGFFIAGMVLMATNLSTIVMMIPGVHHVQEGNFAIGPTLFAYGVLLVFVMIPALFPVGLVSIFGHRSDAVLTRVNGFVSRNSRKITGVICALLAIYLSIGAFR